MHTTTAGIVTVGDELLAGEIENTNATWLAARLRNRGVSVREIRVVPDELDPIARTVGTCADRYDATLVTGGLGSTPDDVTMAAIAMALERPLVPHDEARALIRETVAEIHERRTSFTFDLDAACQRPQGAAVIPNDEGIAPGCRCESVYVLPGIPSEMRAVFGRIEPEFAGTRTTETVYSNRPESNIAPTLAEGRDRFGVKIGCYPGGEWKRITVAGTDQEAVDAARRWLLDRAGFSSERRSASGEE